MNSNILIYLLIIFIIIISYKIYKESDSFNLRCIISSVDGNRYCVRDRLKLDMAANRLAEVNMRLKKLVKYIKNKFPEEDMVKRIVKNYNPKKIYETLPTSEYTAYSENKGEKIAFCLDTEKNSSGKLIDINTLMYVALHELAHTSCISTGHNDEFWRNFKFLIIQAKDINIYNPVDYKKSHARYCGTYITDNPYYDYNP